VCACVCVCPVPVGSLFINGTWQIIGGGVGGCEGGRGWEMLGEGGSGLRPASVQGIEHGPQ